MFAAATTLTVLSPHLDDAALAVGATLAGNRSPATEIWTVYTAGPSLDEIPAARRPLGDYATRRAEDHVAAQILDVGVRHLGLLERVWRTPQPASLRALFQAPGSGSPSQRPALQDVVREALDRDGVVLAPLGVGNHVDHVEVAVAVLVEATERRALHRVAFYEDFYALSERLRRQHPVTAGRPLGRWAVAGLHAPLAQMAMAVLARVPHGVDLGAALPDLGRRPWRPVPAAIDEREEQAGLAAVQAYGSQAALLGPLRGALPAMIRRHHRAHGGEPLWQVDA